MYSAFTHDDEMITGHWHSRSPLEDATAECLRTSLECATLCLVCAEWCSTAPNAATFQRTIRLYQDCADLCGAVARIVGRQADPDLELRAAALHACALACDRCDEEYVRHAKFMVDHCRACAEACRAAAIACRRLAAVQSRR